MTALRFGARGELVKALQRALNEAKATPVLAVDGDYGPATYAAVRVYRLHHGLGDSGIADAPTLDALGIAEPAPPSQPPASDPPGKVDRVPTHVPLLELAAALHLDWTARFGSPPTSPALRMAMAHLRLEHGVELLSVGWCLRGCYNFNFGNVMVGRSISAAWFRMDAPEIEGGRSVVHHSRWRAFPDVTSGANGYLSELARTFPRMLAAFPSGLPFFVAHQAKLDGYYTDDEADYAGKLARCYEATAEP